ncbi:MAG: carbohydrate-binding protein [Clostridiales bacterium]|jgi:hypothetical protein|nr:carbohydrate-binding protein [Clostridiales bacterium]
MNITITVNGSQGDVKAQSSGCFPFLAFSRSYEEGDYITLRSDEQGYVVSQLEDSIAPVFGFLKQRFLFPIPFGEKKICFSPKNFAGTSHILSARPASAKEIEAYRNLAFNPLDHHSNSSYFPHASANVETRGEAAFAARNAIDGNIASSGHGAWPYESWGINQRDDAMIKIEFGRIVTIVKLVATLRADFPHDNWWKSAELSFSDNSSLALEFRKTGAPQIFDIQPRDVSWVKMSGMIKDETDPSPFPALVQLECWGSAHA